MRLHGPLWYLSHMPNLSDRQRRRLERKAVRLERIRERRQATEQRIYCDPPPNGYFRKLIVAGSGISASDVPPEIVELKRNQMSLLREARRKLR